MNTYQYYLSLSKNYKERFQEESQITDLILVNSIKDKDGAAVAYAFCKYYFLNINVKSEYFGFDDEDFDSFLLEEIVKAANNYSEERKAKFSSMISIYFRNRVRIEMYALNKASKKILSSNSYIAVDDEEVHEQLIDLTGSLDYDLIEVEETVSRLKLSENEMKYISVVIHSNILLKDAEIARELGISRAGVGVIKKSLKKKLSEVYNIPA